MRSTGRLGDGVPRHEYPRDPRRRALLTISSLLLVAACSPAPPGPSAGPAAARLDVASPILAPPSDLVAGHPCTAMAVESCLLPYPSDRWLTADPARATGVRVTIPDDVLASGVLDQLGPGATLADAYGGADGYSALTPVIFELTAPIDPTTLPADGGDLLAVYDVASGRRVAIRAEVSPDAERLWAKNRILMAWPVDRYDYGHTYVAVLNDGLRAAGGGPLGRASGFAEAGDAALAPTRDAVSRVAGPSAWDHALSATRFVVRSKANVTSGVDAMAAAVRAEDHPIRDIWVSPSTIGGAALVTGQVRVTDFRDADGVIPATGSDAVPPAHQPRWIDFTMTMPQYPAGGSGAPVVIYGHGISVQKETMLTVAGTNAAHGLATVGIDIPDHGSRIADGGYLFDLAHPQTLGRLVSAPLQGELDELSLLLAVKQHFGAVDAMPYTPWPQSWGDGRPDIDPTHVLYEGTSMGGFLGAEFVALAPELDGAFLQVAGSGIIDTLIHSLLWPLFTSVEPIGAKPGDTHALIGAAGMLLERSDNTYVLDRIRTAGTPLFLVYAANDGVVNNAESNRLITELGLPVYGDTYVPIPLGTLRIARFPVNGTAASQIPTSQLDGNLLKPLFTHTTFGDPGPMAELDEWLTQRIAHFGAAPN